jgi:hypothetical protein
MRRFAFVATLSLLLASAAAICRIERVEAQEARTSKERLSRKAFDEQRVDNCRVPLELRGPLARPDCEESAASAPASRSDRRSGPHSGKETSTQ